MTRDPGQPIGIAPGTVSSPDDGVTKRWPWARSVQAFLFVTLVPFSWLETKGCSQTAQVKVHTGVDVLFRFEGASVSPGVPVLLLLLLSILLGVFVSRWTRQRKRCWGHLVTTVLSLGALTFLSFTMDFVELFGKSHLLPAGGLALALNILIVLDNLWRFLWDAGCQVRQAWRVHQQIAAMMLVGLVLSGCTGSARPCRQDAQCDEGQVCVGTNADEPGTCQAAGVVGDDGGALSPSPSPTPSPTGTPEPSPVPTPTPEPTPSPLEAVKVAVGQSHVCVLDNRGRVQCMGSNNSRQGGHGGAQQNRFYDFTVVAGLTEVMDLAVGDNHSCAIGTVGTAGVFCWGEGANGTLGTGSNANSQVPSQVNLQQNVLDGAEEISTSGRSQSGTTQTCLRTSAREVWCWGPGTSSAVPTEQAALRGATALFGHEDAICAQTDNGVRCVAPNADLLTDLNCAGLTCLGTARDAVLVPAFGCVVGADGAVSCAGQNEFGVVFPPLPSSDAHLSLRTIAGLDNVVEVGAGSQHVCARQAAGNIQCWGRNLWGAAGQPDTANDLCAVTGVNDCVKPAVISIPSSIDLDVNQMIGCSVSAQGEVSCWGQLRSQQVSAPLFYALVN